MQSQLDLGLHIKLWNAAGSAYSLSGPKLHPACTWSTPWAWKWELIFLLGSSRDSSLVLVLTLSLSQNGQLDAEQKNLLFFTASRISSPKCSPTDCNLNWERVNLNFSPCRTEWVVQSLHLQWDGSMLSDRQRASPCHGIVYSNTHPIQLFKTSLHALPLFTFPFGVCWNMLIET